MALFSRKKSPPPSNTVIPSAALRRLPEVGRVIFGDGPGYTDVSDFYLSGFIAAGSPTDDPAWSRFVEQFVDDLTQASNQLGDWSIPGAFHVAKDFVKMDDWSKPALVDLMDRALTFLISVGADRGSIPNFAIPRWVQLQQQT